MKFFLNIPLYAIPDEEFIFGGIVTDICRRHHYDESGRVVVNNLSAWHMTLKEFIRTIRS